MSGSNLISLQQLEIPSNSHTIFTIHGLNLPSYAVVQIHAFHYNVTLSLAETKLSHANHQNGTNLGFVLKRGGNDSQAIHLWNNNFEDVHYLLALIAYNKSAPLVGGCNLETKLARNPTLEVEREGPFTILKTPMARPSEKMSKAADSQCIEYKSLTHVTYYKYIEQFNFRADAYFEAVKSLIFGNHSLSGYQVSFRVTCCNLHKVTSSFCRLNRWARHSNASLRDSPALE